jgi:ubiquinone/menaquinone biosynthesis C-methylase UbiE
MALHTCPWWLGFGLASPFRRIFYNPRAILQPFVRPGMTVLEPGPGMGFFTIELARLTGQGGRVVAVDIQRQMLEGLKRRSERSGVADRIESRLADAGEMPLDDLKGRVDFVLAFAMVHELPDPLKFFKDAIKTLTPEGKLLISEPSWHVREEDFRRSLKLAEEAGFRVESEPKIKSNRSALMGRA